MEYMNNLTERKYIMSGGHFDYQQLWLNDIANELEQLIMRAGREIPRKEIESEWYGYYQNCYDDCIVTKNYPDYDLQTIAIMKRAVYVMRLAYIYAQRIDWVLSGDILVGNLHSTGTRSSTMKIPAAGVKFQTMRTRILRPLLRILP
jgi:hypothetical protein